ncbi:MAG: PaaI family thioesterase [Sphingobium sp.]
MGDEPMTADAIDPRLVEMFAHIPRNGHNAAVGIGVSGFGRGWTECYVDWREELVSDVGTGILASGPIISLMDVACGCSVWSAIDDITSSVTLDLRVDYLRPARPGRRVVGRGECYHVTRRVAFVRGSAHDGDPERPIAKVAGSFFYTGSVE